MNYSTLSWCLEMCVTKLCFTVRCSSLLHFFQSSRASRCTNISSWCQRVCVLSDVGSLKASPSKVPRKAVGDGGSWSSRAALERERETEHGDVDLIFRSRDVDDGAWFGLEGTLDRTLSATGPRTVCRKAMQNIGWPVQQ